MAERREHADDGGYLHGYSAAEQQRLVSQARYLAPWIYAAVDFAAARHAVEIGCGVGAQLAILRRRFPLLRVTGVDRSPAQLAAARALLAGDLASGMAALAEADGVRLPFPDAAFDALFLCWILEHTPTPAALLREAWRVSAPGAAVVCTEVFNASLFVAPACPAISEYWQRFNAYQRELGGDPDIGVRVPGLLAAAGFREVALRPLPFLLDPRTQPPAARAAFLEYWQGVLSSGAAALLAAGRVDAALIAEVAAGFARLARDPGAHFYVTAMQTTAVR